eukprot:COSAG06_NODE_43670_length_370_cov_0.494465_2_plen_88_part_01
MTGEDFFKAGLLILFVSGVGTGITMLHSEVIQASRWADDQVPVRWAKWLIALMLCILIGVLGLAAPCVAVQMLLRTARGDKTVGKDGR